VVKIGVRMLLLGGENDHERDRSAAHQFSERPKSRQSSLASHPRLADLTAILTLPSPHRPGLEVDRNDVTHNYLIAPGQ